MVVMFKRLLRLFGVCSPSEPWVTPLGTVTCWEDLGRLLSEGMARGAGQVDARRADLLVSGMTPEEAQAVLMREFVLNADPAMLAYSEGVVRRSFWTLYEDDEEG